MRTRTLLRGGVAVTLVALVMSILQSSHADELYPGLRPDATSGGWANAGQGGISYAKRAKQWFRPPAGMATALVDYGQLVDEPLWERRYVSGEAYFVSPEGAPANYGYLEPMTVRSVGFGLMPVEATVQVSQRRENGYPVPLSVRLLTEYYYEERGGFRYALRLDAPSVTVQDAFNVEILSVKVDGVDLGLTGGCRTVEPAPVTLVTPAYSIPDPLRLSPPNYQEYWFKTHDPSTYFHPFYGGQLSGEITIPPFTGCTTAAGDDLSKLMTLSVSGPGNPIKASAGWPCGIEVDGAPWPAAPGQSNPKLAGCPGAKPFEYPARDGG